MPPPERTPEQWAEDVARAYHGGLVEIDLGDSPYVYVGRERGIALALRLLDLYGVPVHLEMLDDTSADPDARYVPAGLLPPDLPDEPTGVVTVEACQRVYRDTVHDAIRDAMM